MRIKELPTTERPRERLLQVGVQHLSNQELIAILFLNGTKKHSAIDLAGALLAQTKKGLWELETITPEELCTIEGIGPGKACTLLAAIELGRRMAHHKARDSFRISSPESVYDLLSSELLSLNKEVFVVLHLNTKNDLIYQENVSVGTLNASLIHPREVFNQAVRKGSASIIVVHNHPSGDVSPSPEDASVTKRLKEVGIILGIPLLDHIIIGKESIFSFKRQGLL